MRQLLREYLNPRYMPHFTLGAGILGILLRIWLLAGTDDKGLLVPGHIADTLSWILSGLVVALLILGALDLKEGSKYRFNFPASPAGAIGSCAAALGILIASISELIHGSGALSVISSILGILSSAGLVFTGYCRLKGGHPAFFFHALVCVYMMIHLVCLYRLWSSDPQLQDYVFQLLAIVCLMLACYHRAAFDANTGSRRGYAVFSLAAVYFCMISLPGCRNPAFFLGNSLWMMTNLCSLTPLISRR